MELNADQMINYIARHLNPNVSSPREWTYGSLRYRCNNRFFGQAIQTMMDMGWVEYNGWPDLVNGTLYLTEDGIQALLK